MNPGGASDALGPLGRGLPADTLVALGTDAVRGLQDELLRDARPATADRVELEPLDTDLELPAPRAVEEQASAGPRLAQCPGEPGVQPQ